MATFQLDIGGPLSPASSGPQTNEIEVLDALRPEAASVKVLADEGEVNKQLLLRKLGSLVPEKDARCTTPDGKSPDTVRATWCPCRRMIVTGLPPFCATSCQDLNVFTQHLCRT